MVYGLIIGNELFHIKRSTSERKYNEICQALNMEDEIIEVDKKYPESLWNKLGKKASQVLEIEEPEFYLDVGKSFVRFVQNYQFDRLVSRIGRNYREFVMNLDNVHQFLNQRFAQMKAPSFFVESETAKGMTLIYRSKRRGYSFYTIGQMQEISKVYFNLDMSMKLIKREVQFDTLYVKYQLEFDNSPYLKFIEMQQKKVEQSLPFKAVTLFEMFPFAILLNSHLEITLIGESLRKILPNCIGQPFTKYFILERPIVDLEWTTLLTKTNNVFIFQLLIHSIHKTGRFKHYKLISNYVKNEDDKLALRGQFIYISEWKKLLFLGCPMIHDLKTLIDHGLCISDLSSHDLSRDIMMANMQKQFESNMSNKMSIDNSVKLADIERRFLKTCKDNQVKRELGIPKELKGSFVLQNTPNLHSNVVILQASIDELSDIGTKSRMYPKKMIKLMEDTLAVFDHLSKKNKVVSINTNHGYMVVSGLINVAQYENIGTLAVELRQAATQLKDHTRGKFQTIRFKIGITYGPVVSALIGHSVPNFCLFGATVTHSEFISEVCLPGKILMSQKFKNELPPTFRYSNPDAKTAIMLKGDVCFLLDAKEEHVLPSIAPVLRAYSKFRGTKTQEIIAETPITLSSEIITLSTDEEDMMILTTSSKQSTLCLPRYSSKICNIL